MLDELVKEIAVTGGSPQIRIYWDSKLEDLQFEVLK